MMKKKVWIAASKKGQIRVFTSYPVRDEHFGIFCGESIGCISMLVMLFESDGLELPNLTWKDEPVELEISISVCHG